MKCLAYKYDKCNIPKYIISKYNTYQKVKYIHVMNINFESIIHNSQILNTYSFCHTIDMRGTVCTHYAILEIIVCIACA